MNVRKKSERGNVLIKNVEIELENVKELFTYYVTQRGKMGELGIKIAAYQNF